VPQHNVPCSSTGWLSTYQERSVNDNDNNANWNDVHLYVDNIDHDDDDAAVTARRVNR